MRLQLILARPLARLSEPRVLRRLFSTYPCPPRTRHGEFPAKHASRRVGCALIALAWLACPAISDADWDTRFGTGANNTVTAVATDGAGNLYVGGDFSVIGGVSANRIAKWNGTSWSALGSGMDGSVWALAVDANGNLYAGGLFPTADGLTVNQIARWNGTSWSALGSGINGAVTALAIDLSLIHI